MNQMNDLKERLTKIEEKLEAILLSQARLVLHTEQATQERKELKDEIERVDREGSKALHEVINRSKGAMWILGILASTGIAIWNFVIKKNT